MELISNLCFITLSLNWNDLLPNPFQRTQDSLSLCARARARPTTRGISLCPLGSGGPMCGTGCVPFKHILFLYCDKPLEPKLYCPFRTQIVLAQLCLWNQPIWAHHLYTNSLRISLLASTLKHSRPFFKV